MGTCKSAIVYQFVATKSTEDHLAEGNALANLILIIDWLKTIL